MQEIREVHHYEESNPSNNTAIIVIAVLLLAALVVGAFVWQPWATQPASTTIIHDQPVQSAPRSEPSNIVVNPPQTDVNIHNDVPPVEKKDKTEDGGAGDAGAGTTGDGSTSTSGSSGQDQPAPSPSNGG